MGSKSSSSTSSTSSQVSTTSNLSTDQLENSVVFSNVEVDGDVSLTDAGAINSAFEYASEVQEGSADLIEKAIVAGQQQISAFGGAVNKILQTEKTDGATAMTGVMERFSWGFGLVGMAGIVWAWRSNRA